MMRLADFADSPPGPPVEEMIKDGTSPVLKFLARLLTLIFSCIAWLLVLIASALMLLFHLIAMAVARGTDATLSAVLRAEVRTKDDVSLAFARLLGRTPDRETSLSSRRQAA